MKQRFSGWPPEALEFFRELEHNNNREWFQAHRKIYAEAVRGPLEALLDEVRGQFGDAKVYRPNRDTRFSVDKTPYKKEIYAVVYHPGAGGWYVQLNKDGVFTGGGLYAPDRESLANLRAAIASDETGRELEATVAGMEAQGVDLMTEGALKTVPRGYPADHPRSRFLRLQHFAAGKHLPAGPWLHTSEAKQRVLHGWRAVTPLLEWIARIIPPAPTSNRDSR